MRVGLNPNKDKILEDSNYIHQVVIPVYIPNHNGYFKDSLKVLNLCINSLINTVHNKTFITIINNGSSQITKKYLEELFDQEKIHELIHANNIGKLNAIIKGVVGNNIELVTISDADVLFLPNWQNETVKIFNILPKAGVVGLVPQFKMYEANSSNVIFDNFFNKSMKFLPVKNSDALEKFYSSVGWKSNYSKDYLEYNLGLEVSVDLKVLIGAGHFVATYKKDMFKEITSYMGYKLGGTSETYLDIAPLKKDYWRLTTQDNFAYHMGNTFEDWMKVNNTVKSNEYDLTSNFQINKKINNFIYFLKNRLFAKLIFMSFFNRIFLKWKKLPKHMVKRY